MLLAPAGNAGFGDAVDAGDAGDASDANDADEADAKFTLVGRQCNWTSKPLLELQILLCISHDLISSLQDLGTADS